ncbi:MmyB family transcriptional regulator [Streptomyces sp. NPDC054794]
MLPSDSWLTVNALADAFFSPFRRADNLGRMTFPDPAARGFFRHWDRAAEARVAELRQATGLAPDHSPSARGRGAP